MLVHKNVIAIIGKRLLQGSSVKYKKKVKSHFFLELSITETNYKGSNYEITEVMFRRSH